MNIDAKIGGRRLKGDTRDIRNWTGVLKVKATREYDQYILAAIAEMLRGSDRTSPAYDKLCDVADELRTEYFEQCEGDTVLRIVQDG